MHVFSELPRGHWCGWSTDHSLREHQSAGCAWEEAEQGLAPPLLFSCLCSTSFLAPSVCTAPPSLPASVSHPVSTCPEEKSPVFRNQGPDSLCSPGGPSSHSGQKALPTPLPAAAAALGSALGVSPCLPSTATCPSGALSADLRGRGTHRGADWHPLCGVSQQEMAAKSLPSLSP